MPKYLRWGMFAWLLALAGAASAQPAPPAPPQHVKAALIGDAATVVQGSVFTVAVRLTMDKGWHTYWKNPGDTGLPTTVTWTLPDGVVFGGKVLDGAQAGALQWPAPQAQVVGPFMNYGFEHGVLLLTDFSYVPTSAMPPTLTLKARIDWLMCKDICIPDGADVSLTLKTSSSPQGLQPAPAEDVAAITATQAALPKPLSGWRVSARGDGDATITLRFTPDLEAAPIAIADPGALYFFPEDAEIVEPSFAQPLRRDGDVFMLTLPVSHQLKSDAIPRLRGVLRSENAWSAGDDGATAVTIDVPVEGAVAAGPVPKFDAPPAARPPGMTVAATAAEDVAARAGHSETDLSLGLAALFALLGGVILNLMPCVFPVISLKVLGFVQHGDNRATLRHEAFAFGGGVIVTFVALGVLLLALRTMGAHLGWGFQLQSPIMITALAFLFFVMALNLSGLFEFGMLAPSALAGWTSKNRTLDALGSGVLAVAVASPCTAPFMGAALGYALTQSFAATLVVFALLGVGMALPYALLALFPSWQRLLPKPGAWMVRLRQLLAFPLYATVAWLAWVLGAQEGGDVELRLLLALVMAALALWAWHGYRTTRGSAAVRAGWMLTVALGVLAAAWLISPVFLNASGSVAADSPPASSGTAETWQPYSAARVAQENAAGSTVFVDFTAAWCVTCQANKKWVLDTDDVQQAFARRGVVLLRADWTRRDPAISDALLRLGRSGVPVYVFYRPGKPPLLLPELLQKGTVLEALQGLDGP